MPAEHAASPSQIACPLRLLSVFYVLASERKEKEALSVALQAVGAVKVNASERASEQKRIERVLVLLRASLCA